MTTPGLVRETESVCEHGEGPYWSTGWGGLRWIDMRVGDVLHLADDGTVRRQHVGDRVACVRPAAGGGAVVATDYQVGLVSAESLAACDGLAEPFAGGLWPERELVFNEGGVDPSGRFWCGSATDDGVPGAGAMYRFDGRSSERLFDGVTISNGLAWTQDGSTGYYIDSVTQSIARLGVAADGSVTREPWVTIPGDLGEPDGLCVDTSGAVWVAIWGGHEVRRYSAEGVLVDRVPVPAPHVTACCLGGDDLRTLYITTSQIDTDLDEYPQAGSLFSVRVPDAGFVGPLFDDSAVSWSAAGSDGG